MNKENYNIEIENTDVPFLLVRFTNKSDGEVKRARFDLGKRIFIDSVPCPSDSDLRDSIVSMYHNESHSNEDLWILSVSKSGVWQTPLIFQDSQKEEMDKLIVEEKSQRSEVRVLHIFGMAVAPLRQHFIFEHESKLEEQAQSAMEALNELDSHRAKLQPGKLVTEGTVSYVLEKEPWDDGEPPTEAELEVILEAMRNAPITMRVDADLGTAEDEASGLKWFAEQEKKKNAPQFQIEILEWVPGLLNSISYKGEKVSTGSIADAFDIAQDLFELNLKIQKRDNRILIFVDDRNFSMR